MTFSSFDNNYKFFGISGLMLQDSIVPIRKISTDREARSDLKVNFFESFYVDGVFSWNNLAYKSMAVFSPMLLPLKVEVNVLDNLFQSLVKLELLNALISLFMIPYYLIIAETLPSLMILANLVDLVGSLITTLSEAYKTNQTQPAVV
jgi:hypothetical protein